MCYNCVEKAGDVMTGPIVIAVVTLVLAAGYFAVRRLQAWKRFTEKYEELFHALTSYATVMFVLWQVGAASPFPEATS